MKLKHYAAALCVMAVLIAVAPGSARAQSSDLSSMLELLQTLMKQVEDLQKQLATIRGEIREEIKLGLKEGMEDDDVKAIQELLATDPTLYPRGIVSGYYGPLTKEALMRFQERYGLTMTGEVDEETRELLQELFKERQNGKFPPGLLRAPGIDKKIKDRLYKNDDDTWELDCDDRRAVGPLCKDRDDDEDGEEDDDDRPRIVASTTAAAAIDSAEDAIEDLEAALASTTVTGDEKEEAEDDLAEAKDTLADAKDEYEDGDYREARDEAIDAKRIALRALDELLDEEAEDEGDEDED